MPAPVLTSADYLRAFQALMPRGKVWPRVPDATQTMVLQGLSKTYERNTERANYLLIDVFPASTVELLPEWEATLGLPDPCAGEAPTIQQRRAQVVSRLSSTGGQSALYFMTLAEKLGYLVTVTNNAPFRAGQSSAGEPVGSLDWAHTWTVNAPINSPVRFAAGSSSAGEPLASWGNDVLECEIRANAPAHTILIFAYSDLPTFEDVSDVATLVNTTLPEALL